MINTAGPRQSRAYDIETQVQASVLSMKTLVLTLRENQMYLSPEQLNSIMHAVCDVTTACSDSFSRRRSTTQPPAPQGRGQPYTIVERYVANGQHQGKGGNKPRPAHFDAVLTEKEVDIGYDKPSSDNEGDQEH